MTEEDTEHSRTTGNSAVASAIGSDETIALLQDLVRIASPYFEEAEISRWIYEWLADAGLDPDYHDVSEPELTGFEGRNVIARLHGSDRAAPTLLVNAHVDTVQIADDWDEDPLSARIEDGKLYGQGAADMKAGLAAAMMAFRAIAEHESDLEGSLILTAVVDEEGPYGLGTDQLIRDGVTDECDMAIVPEPGPILAQEPISNPALLLGARGRYLYDITIRGEPGHAARPDGKLNAVADAGRLAAEINNLPLDSHPQLGSGSICPLLIDGGGETLSIPHRCRLVADRHVVFGEDEAKVKRDVEELVDRLNLGSDVEVGFREVPHPEARYGPYVTDRDHALVQTCHTAVRNVMGQAPSYGYFASVGDFNYLGARAELPTVILGPDGGNVHGAGEFVYTEETVDTARIIAETAHQLLT
jgi:succinyl-diaminopimelate desuccinylase